MSGLRIYRSNQLERLAVALAAMITEQLPDDPFAPIDILVGSRGMERWLRHKISEHGGICAQVRFQFPARFIEDRLQEIEGVQVDETLFWSSEGLQWTLLELWSSPALLGQPMYAPLKRYLDEEEPQVVSRRRYRLAAKLGEIFDRYTVFRPTWAQAWSQQRDCVNQPSMGDLAWQKFLWHDLTRFIDGGDAPNHMASRMDAAVRAIRESQNPTSDPLYIFGVSSLPPLWLEFLAEVAHQRPVDVFLFSPSNEYWGEIQRCSVSEWRTIDRDELPDALRDRKSALLPEHNQGHPLLASLGRVGRDTQIILESLSTDYVELDLDLFHDPADTATRAIHGAEPNTLQWLQSDILHMRTPEDCQDLTDWPTRCPNDDDESIQIHRCHGPLRQVEVLRETLLGLFEKHPHLEPRDVVVMTPDIERYAPLISSVFDRGFSERRRDHAGHPIQSVTEAWGTPGGPRIPFQIADLTVRRMNPVADILMRTISLACGRLEASNVAELLQLEPIQMRFEFQADDLPTLHRWITESGIRWGRDDQHREQHGQPALHQNTWRFGLDRLLLGVTAADEGHPLCETLPYDDMEGQSVLLLGRFVDFIQTLFHCIDRLTDPKTPSQWVDTLKTVIDKLTLTTSSAAWLTRRVRDVLDALEKSSQRCTQRISIEAIQAELDGRFEIPDMTPKTQNGAVSFCALRPMRGIPYSVVCLLGMDEGTCPRPTSRAAFDLCAMHPRIGDTQPRDDDRYMVLEALLSARKHFLMFYTGRSETTNEVLAPAVPVGEIMDVLNSSFPCPPESKSVGDHFTYSHPLQPFSPLNFIPGGIHRRLGCFSFDRAQLPNDINPEHLRGDPPFFLDIPSTQIEESHRHALQRVKGFFRHPTKYMLNQTLKLRFEQHETELLDREPMELDTLARWTLRKNILDELLQGGSGQMAFQRCVSEGQLPLGRSGEMTFQDAHRLARLVFEHRERYPKASEESLQVDTVVGQHEVVGQVMSLAGDTLVYCHVSERRNHHLLEAWIDLLAAYASSAGHIRKATVICHRKVRGQVHAFSTHLTHPGNDSTVFETLLRLFLRGRESPVPLFKMSSPDWVQGQVGRAPRAKYMFDVLNAHDVESPEWQPVDDIQNACLKDGLKRARAAYQNERFGDATDAYVQHVFGPSPPFVDAESVLGVTSDFARSALQVWAPIFRALSTGDDS